MDKSNAIEVIPMPAPLEYAPQSAVGDMTLSRVGGVTTITVKPGWRRIMRVGWIAAIAAIYWGIVYPALHFFASRLSGLPTVEWNGPAVAVGVGLAISAIASIKVLVFTLHGHRWTASVEELQFAGRRVNEIVRQSFPRATIGYLKVDRLRLKNQARKSLYLTIVKPDGNKVAILGGTRAELEFACHAFSEALAIPTDPFSEAAYPAKPPGARVKIRIMANGVAVSLHPALLGFEGWAIIAASLAIPACVIELLHRNLPMFVDVSALSLFGFVASIGFSILLAAGLLKLRLQIRRVTHLAWIDGTLHLTERSILKPCAEAWKLTDARWLELSADSPAKYASLRLRLADASTVPLIDRALARDVRFIHQMLSTAIALPRTSPPTLPTPPPA